MKIPEGLTGDELFKFLIENKETLISQKKFEMKRADAVWMTGEEDGEDTNKATGTSSDPNKITARLVINTTKILDSHGDVHIDGIWNRSVKNTKLLYLLKEHKMQFENIISDKVKASVEEMDWKQVGVHAVGKTQALVFTATIEKARNPYMFDQYVKGYVRNHSVGMRYVQLELAVNSEDKMYMQEKAVWDKYLPEIVNRKDAEAQGYFWAVTEAKIIEGSAVPMGSNTATPTLDITDSSADTQGKGESSPQKSVLTLQNFI